MPTSNYYAFFICKVLVLKIKNKTCYQNLFVRVYFITQCYFFLQINLKNKCSKKNYINSANCLNKRKLTNYFQIRIQCTKNHYAFIEPYCELA